MVLKEVENWQIIHSTVMLLLTIQDMTGKKTLIHTVKAPSSHLEQGQLIQFQEIQIPFFIYIFTLKCRPLIYNSEPQKGLNGNICPVCCSVLFCVAAANLPQVHHVLYSELLLGLCCPRC